jgi:ketosteroid isomerase-like protein
MVSATCQYCGGTLVLPHDADGRWRVVRDHLALCDGPA